MEIAFSTSHPDVLAAWAGIIVRYDEARAAALAFAEEFGAQAVRVSRGQQISFVGLKADEVPGPGWRLDNRIDAFVPDRRTKIGRGHHKRMAEIVATNQRALPGMPDIVLDSRTSHWHEACIGDHDGVIWVGWACSIELLRENTWSRTKLDEVMWQQRRLSEFYTAEEAHKDARVS